MVPNCGVLIMNSLIRVIITFNVAILLAAVAAMPVMAQSTKTTAATSEAISYSQAELDQMLAPIALYPDSVLSHLLIAATYPLEIVMADRWVKNNSRLTGDDAINAVDGKQWDASVKALVAFPAVLKRLSEDLDWTESLGEAFLSDEELVLQTIQDLRQRAYDEGNLDSLDHLRVTNEDNEIVIEPARRDVVYIPVYNTRIVYGPWWWNNHPPIYWHHDDFYYRRNHVVYWGPSVYLSHTFFFSGFHWSNHHVVIVDRRYRHRYYNNYYSNRHIARHQHSRRWEHDRRHRRGVEYRNPRTRDYFERRHQTDQRSSRSVRARSERTDRSQRRVERGLRRNDQMDTRSIKRDRRESGERVRDGKGDRVRGERDAARRTNNGDQNSSENTRSIRKERANNDSRNNVRAREVDRGREANRTQERSSRKEVRVERAVESKRKERTEKRIDRRSIKNTNKYNRRSESKSRSVRRERTRSERSSNNNSRQRAIRERRFK